MLLLGAIGLALGAVRATPGGVPLLTLVLLAATIAHGLVETQSRYNFPLVPLLLVPLLLVPLLSLLTMGGSGRLEIQASTAESPAASTASVPSGGICAIEPRAPIRCARTLVSGSAGLELLGRAERVRCVYEVDRDGAGRNEIQRLVDWSALRLAPSPA